MREEFGENEEPQGLLSHQSNFKTVDILLRALGTYFPYYFLPLQTTTPYEQRAGVIAIRATASGS